jgi:hypothetical protein
MLSVGQHFQTCIFVSQQPLSEHTRSLLTIVSSNAVFRSACINVYLIKYNWVLYYRWCFITFWGSPVRDITHKVSKPPKLMLCILLHLVWTCVQIDCGAGPKACMDAMEKSQNCLSLPVITIPRVSSPSPGLCTHWDIQVPQFMLSYL